MPLVRGANPALAAPDVIALVERTSVDLGTPGQDPTFGAGRVDAAGAVALALGLRATTRVAGDDRYATAAQLSAGAYPDGADTVYLARGDVFSPDALTGGPAAIVKQGPVLLTQQCALPDETAAELTRLQASQVIVLGGVGAVCDAVIAQIQSLATHPSVRRVAGFDRDQ